MSEEIYKVYNLTDANDQITEYVVSHKPIEFLRKLKSESRKEHYIATFAVKNILTQELASAYADKFCETLNTMHRSNLAQMKLAGVL